MLGAIQKINFSYLMSNMHTIKLKVPSGVHYIFMVLCLVSWDCSIQATSTSKVRVTSMELTHGTLTYATREGQKNTMHQYNIDDEKKDELFNATNKILAFSSKRDGIQYIERSSPMDSQLKKWFVDKNNQRVDNQLETEYLKYKICPQTGQVIEILEDIIYFTWENNAYSKEELGGTINSIIILPRRKLVLYTLSGRSKILIWHLSEIEKSTTVMEINYEDGIRESQVDPMQEWVATNDIFGTRVDIWSVQSLQEQKNPKPIFSLQKEENHCSFFSFMPALPNGFIVGGRLGFSIWDFKANKMIYEKELKVEILPYLFYGNNSSAMLACHPMSSLFAFNNGRYISFHKLKCNSKLVLLINYLYEKSSAKSSAKFPWVRDLNEIIGSYIDNITLKEPVEFSNKIMLSM